MVGITYVYIDKIFALYGNILSYPSLLLSWVFENDCLDTCCFWMSYMHVFLYFLYLHLLSAVEHVSHGKAL